MAVSNIDSAEDLKEVRELIGSNPVKVLAKIQNRHALQDISAIISKADGIIISRGTLKLNLTAPNLVYVQDYIIQKCKLASKPVYLASQITDSMVSNPMASHSEIADISLSVHQGVDGLVLSGETACGPFYREAVQLVSQVCVKRESHLNNLKNYNYIDE